MGEVTREQVWKRIAEARNPENADTVEGLLGGLGVDWATDAVMALLALLDGGRGDADSAGRANPTGDDAPPRPFRIGRSLGVTVYSGPESSDFMGTMQSREYAALVVNALNGAGVSDDVVLGRLQDSEGELRDRLRELEAIAGAAGHGWKVAKEVADKAVETYERQVDDLREQLRFSDLERERQRIRQAEANDRIRELEAKAPQPRVLTAATLVHEGLSPGGFRGHVIPDDNSIWDLPPGTRVLLVEDTEAPA